MPPCASCSMKVLILVTIALESSWVTERDTRTLGAPPTGCKAFVGQRDELFSTSTFGAGGSEVFSPKLLRFRCWIWYKRNRSEKEVQNACSCKIGAANWKCKISISYIWCLTRPTVSYESVTGTSLCVLVVCKNTDSIWSIYNWCVLGISAPWERVIYFTQNMLHTTNLNQTFLRISKVYEVVLASEIQFSFFHKTPVQ